MENCDTMWSINKNFQTITMKMCVETVIPVLLEYNITNLTIPSLHNATLNTTKNVSFISNILNHTNITQYFPIVNKTNTSNTNKTANISNYAPSRRASKPPQASLFQSLHSRRCLATVLSAP